MTLTNYSFRINAEYLTQSHFIQVLFSIFMTSQWLITQKETSQITCFLDNFFNLKCCRRFVDSVKTVISIVWATVERIVIKSSWNLYLFQRESDKRYQLILWWIFLSVKLYKFINHHWLSEQRSHTEVM